MDILMNQNKKLKTINDEFQKNFPFLKLEFYSKSHKPGEGSIKNNTINTNLTLGEISRLDKEKIINIEKSMKVSELETAFLTITGLNVQVFRKSNNTWLQTTITDNWSLEKQNRNGMEMSMS